MSENFLKCVKELEKVMKYKSPERKAILKYLSNKDSVYHALREISLNILNKKLPLKKKHLEKLDKHHKVMKRLKQGSHSKIQRRKLVQQSGGFLPWLIPAIVSAIPAVIDLINK